jgi:hypothetical protein
VVCVLASGTQDRGFAPDRSRRIFPVGKIHSMPSFGRGSKIICPVLVTRTTKKGQKDQKLSKRSTMVQKKLAEAVGFFFGGVKILSMPSVGRKVKLFVPCRRFAARKRTLLDYGEVGSLRPNYLDLSRSKVPSFANRGLQRSSRFGDLCRGAPTLEQHGCPLELKGGNQNDAVHKGPV